MLKPDILEAICEIIYMPLGYPDNTISGMYYMKVQGKMPGKSVKRGIQMFLPSLLNDGSRDLLVEDLTQFRSDSGELVNQVGDNISTTNFLSKFDWPHFKEESLETFNTYRSLFDRERKIRRISLKYIYRFYIDSYEELENLNNLKIIIPEKKNYSDLSAFNLISEFSITSESILAIAVNTAHSEIPDKICIIADFSIIMNAPEKIDEENISDWLDSSHMEIESSVKSLFDNVEL